MDILYKRLPKDLVFIIEDYAKDRTNYDIVIQQFNLQTDLQEIYWIIYFPGYSRVFWASDNYLQKYGCNKYHTINGYFEELPSKRLG